MFRPNRQGASIVDLLLLFIFASFCLCVGLLTLSPFIEVLNPPAKIAESANNNAKVYATEMGWSIKGSSCSGADSDGDGYVSCSVNLSLPEGKEEVKGINCGYDRVFAPLGQNTGCKIPNIQNINLVQ